MHLPPSIIWHALPLEEVFKLLESSPKGLSREEAERRLRLFGPNRLPPPPRRPALKRFLAQFNNVLIHVLLAAALVTAFLQHWVDTGVILGVVVINALIGFIQEGKAEKALEAIRHMLSPRATVMRDGHRIVIPAEEVVPGDVVFLQAGDRIPADLRLVEVRNLQVDESILTGESLPIAKSMDPVPPHAAIGDRACMAFSGTLVTTGQGMGIAVATGERTEIGRISAMLAQVKPLTTPLLRQLERFGRQLTAAILAVSALTFLFGILRGYGADAMFMAVVGLAVAAIPEGLPAIVSITLAIGVQRMARRRAIIRRLPAVETLGAVTVICSDKTGTLTKNEMTVTRIQVEGARFEVTGVGYDPHGGFCLDGKEVSPETHPPLLELLRAGLLCNDAEVHLKDGRWQVVGDPLEGALLIAALKAGLDPAFEREARPRTDVIPFDAAHRFMATLHHDHQGHAFIYVKGAPERVLALCREVRRGGDTAPVAPHLWERHLEELAAEGLRLIALAFRPAPFEKEELLFEDVEQGLVLLGVCGMMDPPREEAIEAVGRCREAGIRVKMITGDHPLTARVIGRMLGIGDGKIALIGQVIDEMGDDELRRLAPETDIFARVNPLHKLRLVRILQKEGHIVAMTGDGVNDAPALKQADIGVAMGMKGTEVAKEAAEMVIADDNFATIAAAVEEGRTVYENIQKAILFILPTNGGEAFSLIAAILFGMILPITPLQILWVNMITAVTLALALPFEPPEADVMKRPPRDPDAPLFSPFFVWRIFFVTAILVVSTFGLFFFERHQGVDIDTARTMAVNTLVMLEVFYLFNSRHILASSFSLEGIFGNRYALLGIGLVIAFQLLFTYLPFMQTLFSTRPLEAAAWGRIVLVASSVYFLVEAEKALLRRRGSP